MVAQLLRHMVLLLVQRLSSWIVIAFVFVQKDIVGLLNEEMYLKYVLKFTALN